MKLFALLATPLLALTTTAHADTYQYNISLGIPSAFNATMTFDTNALVTGQATISNFISCQDDGNACLSLFLDNSNGNFRLNAVNDGLATYFTPGWFGSVGSHTNGPFNEAVTVTDLTQSASTPEPSSIALLGTGILGLAGMARRRFVSDEVR